MKAPKLLFSATTMIFGSENVDIGDQKQAKPKIILPLAVTFPQPMRACKRLFLYRLSSETFPPRLGSAHAGLFFACTTAQMRLTPARFASTRRPASVIRTRLDSIAGTVGKHGRRLRWSEAAVRPDKVVGTSLNVLPIFFAQPIRSKMSCARLRASTFRLHVLPLRNGFLLGSGGSNFRELNDW